MTKPRKMRPATAARAEALAVAYEAFFDYTRRYDRGGSPEDARSSLYWAKRLLKTQEETGVWLLRPVTIGDRIEVMERAAREGRA